MLCHLLVGLHMPGSHVSLGKWCGPNCGVHGVAVNSELEKHIAVTCTWLPSPTDSKRRGPDCSMSAQEMVLILADYAVAVYSNMLSPAS